MLSPQNHQPQREEITSAHARQRFWQILFPVILTSLLLIALVVYLLLASRGQAGRVEQFGQVATIIVIMPYLITSLISLALIVGFIILFAKLRGAVPGVSGKVIDFFHQVRDRNAQFADLSASPFIKINEFFARIQQALASLRKRLN